MAVILDPVEWAKKEFGGCVLGDVRRTNSLVRFAAKVAADPAASTPAQAEKWSDLKAAYRLINNPNVTFDAIATPHWEATRQVAPGTYLILCDTTEINFGWDNTATGLGPLGQGTTGRGFLLHSGLMVNAETEEVIGLAGQKIHYRKAAPKGESRTKRLARDRESQVWGALVDQIGSPGEGVRFVNVCDRGADNFEVYCKSLLNQQDWIVRAARLNRNIEYQGKTMQLSECIEQLPLAGTYELSYRSDEHGNRTAKIEVRSGTIMMPAPRHQSPWLQDLGITTIAQNVVVVQEVKAPKGVKPLRWVLLTSLPASTFDEAWTVIDYYEQRPVVEDLHKCMKTGCSIEKRQYETSERLEAITGLLSVTAVRLLQIRSASRETPDLPVEDVIPARWVDMLSYLRGKKIETIGEFYRQLAGLGGHMLRSCDGNPGWITLWRGFEKLHMALRSEHKYTQRCG
jgi:hypothetical protein